jgi:hypothetical protein
MYKKGFLSRLQLEKSKKSCTEAGELYQIENSISEESSSMAVYINVVKTNISIIKKFEMKDSGKK